MFCKTLIKMANVRLIFDSTERSDIQSSLECHLNDNNEIFIKIEDNTDFIACICLDKSTAIKFSKTLRTEINKIQD